MFGKDQVRRTGKILTVQTKAKTQFVRGTTNHKLWSGITSPNPGHVPAALLFAYDICHQLWIKHIDENHNS